MSEEKKDQDLANSESKPINKNPRILTVLVIVIVISLIAVIILGYLSYKTLSSNKDLLTLRQTATTGLSVTSTPKVTATTATSITSSTASADKSVAGGSAAIDPSDSQTVVASEDETLSDTTKQYFDWIMAKQAAGENYLETRSYMDLDYLSSDFKDLIETQRQDYQNNPMTASSGEPITGYQVVNNYLGTATEGYINSTVKSSTGEWSVVIQAVKQNSKWVITSVGTAG